MRIAFISPFLFRCRRGVERFTIELSNKLVKISSDIEVDILTWQEKKLKNIDIGCIQERVKILKVPYSRYFQSKCAVPFYFINLLKGHYDSVNIFFAGYGEIAALKLLSLFRNQKVNIIFPYLYSLVPHRYQEFTKCKFIDKADKIISVSKFVADGVKEFCARESQVIHNGFDKELFYPDKETGDRLRFELGFSKDDKILLTVAALEEIKGIQKVIRTLPLLSRRLNNLKYVIVGSGPYEPSLKDIIKETNSGQQVFLVGEQDNLQAYDSMADLVLLFSRAEAFGMVLLEAMGCQLPVVVPKVRPYNEIVKEGTGVFVDASNSQEVCSAIENLLLDENLRRKMGQKARAHVVENFAWDKIARQYYQLFLSQA